MTLFSAFFDSLVKESTEDMMTQFWAFFSVSLVAAFLHSLDLGALTRANKGRKK